MLPISAGQGSGGDRGSRCWDWEGPCPSVCRSLKLRLSDRRKFRLPMVGDTVPASPLEPRSRGTTLRQCPWLQVTPSQVPAFNRWQSGSRLPARRPQELPVNDLRLERPQELLERQGWSPFGPTLPRYHYRLNGWSPWLMRAEADGVVGGASDSEDHYGRCRRVLSQVRGVPASSIILRVISHVSKADVNPTMYSYQ